MRIARERNADKKNSFSTASSQQCYGTHNKIHTLVSLVVVVDVLLYILNEIICLSPVGRRREEYMYYHALTSGYNYKTHEIVL